MKTLVLIRHAKSSWKNPELKDMERPLKKRGMKDAPLMGHVLKDLPITPDCILSSPATRALTTATLVAKAYGMNDSMVRSHPDLYLAPGTRLLQEIRDIGDEYNVAFLVGHNPGLMDLAVSLTGDELEKFPTGSVLGIEFQCDAWREAGMENAKKIFFEFPKKHRKSAKEKHANGKSANGKSTSSKNAQVRPTQARSMNGKSQNATSARDKNVHEKHADEVLSQQPNEPGL